MPKFKVVNPDAPEEIDFYQDIPLVDPDTGMDQLDSDGNILVKRYVNHTVSIKGITEVKNALPAIKTNTRNLEELYQYSHAQNEAQQVAINNNASAIVDLQTSASDMALELETLKNKINGIQGIDIDDLKDYVNTQIPLIKNSYLPLVGGTITGNLTVEEGTITGSLTGIASNATADVNNKALTSYIADIMGANAQLSIIKGDGTTSVISINNVLNASKATNADNTTNLGGYPASDYVRSVNGVNVSENGNVQLGSIVKSVNSIVPDENGNVQLVHLGNSGAITGEIKWFAFNTAPAGYLVCNGATVSRETYADLFAVIGTTFGSGDGSTTFTLPNLIDKFAQGSTTVGTVKRAGLPNITGQSGYRFSGGTSGCFIGGAVSKSHDWLSENSFQQLVFDASRSNSIYGNSSTVQPPALTLLPCIKY